MSNLEENEVGVFLNNENINEIRQMTKKQILGDNYKLLIFKESAFEEVKSIEFSDKTLSRQKTFELINSDNTLQDAAEILIGKSSATKEQVIEQLNLEYGIDDESKLRTMLFASLIGKATENEEMFIINKIKSADLEVYPQTVLFTAIKFMPDLLFTAFQKGKDLTEVIA